MADPIHVADKGREEQVVVENQQQPATVVVHTYPQPTDGNGNILTHNGQPYSQEVLKRYYSQDNKAPNFKDLSQIANEWDQQQLAGQQGNVVTTQPAGTEQQKPSYLVDWSNGQTLLQAYRQGGNTHSKYDLIRDKLKWGRETNTPWDTGLEVLEVNDGDYADHDPTKSFEENEKRRKRQKNAEMWGDIGRLLIGVGNFAGAIGGAPEPGKEANEFARRLTDSQRLRREKAKEQRRAYNKYQLEQIFKQKAEERAREKGQKEIKALDARITGLQNEDKRKQELHDANVRNKNASTELIEARRENEKNKYTQQLRLKQAGGGGRRGGSKSTGSKVDPHDTWAKNKDADPAYTKQWMGENNIQGLDKKNWTLEQIKQYNSDYAVHHAKGNKGGGKKLGLGIGK